MDTGKPGDRRPTMEQGSLNYRDDRKPVLGTEQIDGRGAEECCHVRQSHARDGTLMISRCFKMR